MNTYRVYVAFCPQVNFDLGELTLEQCEILFTEFNLMYTAYRIDEYGNYHSNLDKEFTDKIDPLFLEERLPLLDDNRLEDKNWILKSCGFLLDNPFSDDKNWLLNKTWYVWVNPFSEPEYLDIAPFRFFRNENILEIPGIVEYHLNYTKHLNRCYEQEPVFLENMNELIQLENLSPIEYDITFDTGWINEMGNIIQVLKHNDRYLILNGFSVFVNQLRMGKSSIMAQVVEI